MGWGHIGGRAQGQMPRTLALGSSPVGPRAVVIPAHCSFISRGHWMVLLNDGQLHLYLPQSMASISLQCYAWHLLMFRCMTSWQVARLGPGLGGGWLQGHRWGLGSGGYS